jgi:N4-gp56 family major capsid protein
MSASPMTYGDISPRTAAHAVAKMLTRGVPFLVIEKFGQYYVMPNKASKVAKFRRYNALALATTPLVEGVTPTGSKLTVTDVTATLSQYGDFVPFTDVIEDTHEDPFLQQLQDVLGEQAAQTVETIRYNILKAGTNVFLANGSLRTDVNTPLTLALQRKCTRALKRQNANYITKAIGPDPRFRTEPVEQCFIGLVHPDVENDIRNMSGFISTKQYGTQTPWANEIGAVEDVRYLRSTIFTSFADAGGTAGAMVSTGTSAADVYPVLYLSENAYGIVPLKGKDSLSIMIVNPKPAAGDPLGQRGTAGWKTMQTAVILNDAWMVRAEVAATN